MIIRTIFMKNTKYIIGFLAAALIVLSQYVKGNDLTNSISLKPFPVFWGKETNGIKAGLYVGRIPVKTNTWFEPVLLYNNQTNINGHIQFYLPPFKSRYQAELTDKNGNAVAKSAKGKAIGAPFPPLRVTNNGATFGINRQAGYRYYGLEDKIIDEQQSGILTLQDYFKIQKSGKYHLRFETCLIIPKERSDDLVWIPPVDIDVDVQLEDQ